MPNPKLNRGGVWIAWDALLPMGRNEGMLTSVPRTCFCTGSVGCLTQSLPLICTRKMLEAFVSLLLCRLFLAMVLQEALQKCDGGGEEIRLTSGMPPTPLVHALPSGRESARVSMGVCRRCVETIQHGMAWYSATCVRHGCCTAPCVVLCVVVCGTWRVLCHILRGAREGGGGGLA